MQLTCLRLNKPTVALTLNNPLIAPMVVELAIGFVVNFSGIMPMGKIDKGLFNY